MSEKELHELAATVATAVADAVAERAKICNKTVLTTEEAAVYTGYSVSYIYKLTSAKQIPHFKPTGKACFFNREELEEWMQRNRIATVEELDARAAAYCDKKKGGVKQ